MEQAIHDPKTTVERILSEPIADARARERSEFDRLSAGYPDIVLHGAGKLGRKALAGLRSIGIEPLGFTDNSPSSWGTQVDGAAVLSPADAAARWADSATFVICTFSPGKGRDHASIGKQLTAQGARNVVSFIPLFWKHAELFLPHYRIDLPSKAIAARNEIRRALALIHEERSREEFARQLDWLTAPTFLALDIESPDAEFYFPAGVFALSDHERFVDCGAFDGDTLQAFLAASGGRFDRVDCFEPDPTNFEALSHFVETSGADAARIALHAAAVGSERTTLRFEPLGSLVSSISETGAIEVPCVTLDETLTVAPSYIKMDLEGFEPYALRGARSWIAEARPKLAVSAYHHQDHLWSLLLQIDSYAPGYGYYFRRYGDQFGDVVCYAVETP